MPDAMSVPTFQQEKNMPRAKALYFKGLVSATYGTHDVWANPRPNPGQSCQ